MWVLQTLIGFLWILRAAQSYPVRRILTTSTAANGNFSSDLTVPTNVTYQQAFVCNSSTCSANNSRISGIQNKNEMTSVVVPDAQNKISLSGFSLIGTVIQGIFGLIKSSFLKKQLKKIVPILNDSQAQILKQYPQALYMSSTAEQIAQNMITAQDFINEKRKIFEALRSSSSL